MNHASSPEPPSTVAPPPLNRLAHEKSPYLLQHATNPVDWYPWGEEAFARARREDKPIFLSIGYATCHWCHVMEHDSFEDPEVAALMNQAFINIKVDREERPDIDRVYMTVCQMLTGSGGWPLTIVMTPDKEPFHAATFIPKSSRYGRIGMLELIPKIQEVWAGRRRDIAASAARIVNHLERANTAADGAPPGPDLVDQAYTELAGRFDAEEGGFGESPKFPSPHNLLFLVQYWHRTGDSDALAMVLQTLKQLRQGGIFDHVGLGFHRYSTDRDWLVPHFEKMLYDQALLAMAYTEAYQATGDADLERTVREILEYVLRDMTAPEGGFYSAEDADSEGEEGRFYLWTPAEVETVCEPQDAEFARSVWQIRARGNYADEVSGELTGKNILHLDAAHSEIAHRMQMEPDVFERRLDGVRQKLFAARAKRVHPLKDDKILADWNGLMAAALARAGRVLGEARFVEAASQSIDFVFTTMLDATGRLYHRYRDGEVSIHAFLDDYAFLTWASLELYDATLDFTHLERAIQLQEDSLERFWDPVVGGFYFSAADSEQLLVRQKESHDGAVPSGNSVALHNMIRLARLTARSDLAERADRILAAFGHRAASAASAHTHLVAGLQLAMRDSMEIVIAGDPGADDTRRLLNALRPSYLPHAVVLLVPPGEHGDRARRLAPFAAGYLPVDGKAAAYVCRNFECRLPTTDPAELERLLGEPQEGPRPPWTLPQRDAGTS